MRLFYLNIAFALTFVLILLHQCLFAQTDPVELNLHVPSPDWEDQIFYFLLTDRFNDGAPSNNDQGYEEYDPAIYEKYSGGDIQGVIDQLDYIPMLHSPVPEGFKWDYAAYVAGWQSAYYSAKGASKENYGTKLSTPPSISVEEENNKIILQFSPNSLGDPATLKGAKIYITTWDCNGSEGGYRQITKEGGKLEIRRIGCSQACSNYG